jgi:hypothetical protein
MFCGCKCIPKLFFNVPSGLWSGFAEARHRSASMRRVF